MSYYDDCYDEEIYEKTALDELLSEYEEKCKKILLNSIQEEIDKIKNENLTLGESNKKMRKEISNLDTLKREFEKDKQKLINEGIAAYQREALSGLRCGDTVWTILS